MEFRDIATVLEYLDGKTQTLPSGVTVDVRRDTPAPSAQSRSAPPKPEGVLVRAPCPGRVVPAGGPGAVREGETIGEISVRPPTCCDHRADHRTRGSVVF